MAKHILIIDDEELVSKTLIKLLKKEGYTTEIARSGEEALGKIKKADFDLIISDVRMPGMDGVETIKQIRAYLEGVGKKSVPEVMITGYAEADKYEKAAELEVADYLYKPFDIDEFLSIVKKNVG
ncbi:MAG: response regulator [Candidatus Omnitrophota bacterium]